jgi:hypothetical protein
MTGWDEARNQHKAALAEFVKGNPEPSKALWSHRDDVSIFGGWGAYERGWAAVGPRLTWAASRFRDGEIEVESVVAWEAADLACTVDIEHQVACLDGTSERVPITLRSTHVYRREGSDWRCVHRHADFMTPRQG